MNEELKKELADMLAAFKTGLPVGITAEELTVKLADFEAKLAEKFQTKDYSSELETIKNGMLEIENKLNKQGTVEGKSLANLIVDSFSELGISKMADLKSKGRVEYVIKADNEATTTAVTGTVGRTQDTRSLKFPRIRPTAFIGRGIRTGVVESGKSMLLWTEGAYTSNAGYAGEFAAMANGQSATATEKTRKMAKVGAFQVITEETFEDLPQFAQRVVEKLSESATIFADTEIWSGDGADGGANTQHIYGLKTQGITAFDPALVKPVESPNIADLADAANTQAKLSQYMCNTVWLNPVRVNQLRRTKDSTGQYIVNRLVTGELVMGGMNVIENTGIGADEMLVGDITAIQLWVKRNFEVEIERKADKDYWVYYIYARMQSLVEAEDKKSLVYIDNIDTALAAIATL